MHDAALFLGGHRRLLLLLTTTFQQSHTANFRQERRDPGE
jgi:hypothetical protein